MATERRCRVSCLRIFWKSEHLILHDCLVLYNTVLIYYIATYAAPVLERQPLPQCLACVHIFARTKLETRHSPFGAGWEHGVANGQPVLCIPLDFQKMHSATFSVSPAMAIMLALECAGVLVEGSLPWEGVLGSKRATHSVHSWFTEDAGICPLFSSVLICLGLVVQLFRLGVSPGSSDEFPSVIDLRSSFFLSSLDIFTAAYCSMVLVFCVFKCRSGRAPWSGCPVPACKCVCAFTLVLPACFFPLPSSTPALQRFFDKLRSRCTQRHFSADEYDAMATAIPSTEIIRTLS